ncbi:MAG: peptidoglycan-associated lipoprotein Pal [Bdellovibrionales bacterium]|nr:peptidoglycan-associated lipoprotein Pal [Bdellovibrionales bacterium]
MARRLSLFLISGLFVLGTACSSKKKAAETGDVEGDPSVASKDMSFDPMGSDSGNIEGLATVHFEYDSSTLTAEARQQLGANAEWIKAHGNVTVQIEGHCDSRGSVEYNMALGERRAQSVKDYLVSQGVEANRLTIISYGKEKPIASGENEEAYLKNRRANFVPLPS